MNLILKMKNGKRKQKQESKMISEKIFCPRCKSFNVKKDITASLVLNTPQNWVCNGCGYSNIVFPELKKLETKN